MFAVPGTRESRRLPVLLGGSGLVRHLPLSTRKVPALLRPQPSSTEGGDRGCSHRFARDGS